MLVNSLLNHVVALDIGNSDIKFGLFKKGELVRFWRASDYAPTQQYKRPEHFSNALRSGLASIGNTFDGLVYSTVVPEMDAILRKTIQYCFTLKRDPLSIKPGMTRLPIQVIGYPPTQLGMDRLVSACGAHLMYPETDIILADFGTASTFDVVSADGRFLGGIIAPGIEGFGEILSQKTSLLPHVPFGAVGSIIGQNTVDCIQSGVSYGYLGVVKEILGRLKTELAQAYGIQDTLCIATGGAATTFLRAFPEEQLFSALEPTMTIKGLYALYVESLKPNQPLQSLLKRQSTSIEQELAKPTLQAHSTLSVQPEVPSTILLASEETPLMTEPSLIPSPQPTDLEVVTFDLLESHDNQQAIELDGFIEAPTAESASSFL